MADEEDLPDEVEEKIERRKQQAKQQKIREKSEVVLKYLGESTVVEAGRFEESPYRGVNKRTKTDEFSYSFTGEDDRFTILGEGRRITYKRSATADPYYSSHKIDAVTIETDGDDDPVYVYEREPRGESLKRYVPGSWTDILNEVYEEAVEERNRQEQLEEERQRRERERERREQAEEAAEQWEIDWEPEEENE